MKPRIYEGDEPYLYVLFAQPDHDWAFRVMSALQEARFRLWYDDYLAVGTGSTERIAQRLERAEAIVALISPHFEHSSLCQNLISYAMGRNQAIIPVLLTLPGMDGDRPDYLRDSLSFMLATLHTVAYREEEGPQRLIDLLSRDQQLANCRQEEDAFLPWSDSSISFGIPKTDAIEELSMNESDSLRESATFPPPSVDSGHGLNHCPFCGSTIEVGAQFCIHCGSTLKTVRVSKSSGDDSGRPTMQAPAIPPAETGPRVPDESAPQNRARRTAAPDSPDAPTRDSAPTRQSTTPAPTPAHTPHDAPGTTGTTPRRRKGGFFSKLRDVLPRRHANTPAPPVEPPTPPQVPVLATPTHKPRLSDVRFEVIAPERLVRGRYAITDLVMLEEGFEQVIEQVAAEHHEPTKTTGTGWLETVRGTHVRVRLTSPELGDLGEQQGTWNGRYLRFGFPFMVPEDLAAPQAMLVAQVYFDELPATRLSLVLDCTDEGGQQPSRRNVKPTQSDIREAFVSYASEDRTRVATIIQGMRTARPDLDVFFDVESLRTGEDWQRTLRSRIETCDVLFLCWSQHASASPWVDFEWRYALDAKGIDFIEPVAIEPPYKCPPPPELNSKHFNDLLLYIIDARG